MKLNKLITMAAMAPLQLIAQTYTHPTTGIASEYVGACETATCTGTYTDNGGTGGNYANNINNIYRVFCPNSAGNCVRLTFTQMDMEPMVDPAGPNPLDCYYDYLTIGNGPTQNSTVIDQSPSSAASTTGRICGTPAVPFSYTATGASGCLTVRMVTDGTVNAAGFTATVSCVPCAGGPNGTDNNDCINSTAICSSSNVGSNSTGPGIAAEGCSGSVCPAGGENHSNWFNFTIQTSGTFNFTITPSNLTDDYDYTLYGPNTTCGALGAPVRCSDSGLTGATGLSPAALDVSEDVNGDKLTATLNVVAGQSYYLLIDEWTPTGAGYTLSFSGTASLDCVVLPVELKDFKAQYVPEAEAVDLYWSTESEVNNDYFTVEKSRDGENFDFVAFVDGAGSTSSEHMYFTSDRESETGVIYYRIKQTDFDGKVNYSKTVSVNIIPEMKDEVYIFPTPTNEDCFVTFYSKIEETAEMRVLDAKGNVIETRAINIIKGGDNNFKIESSEYKKGLYFIQINSETKSLSGKLVKE
jgi:hypothetical protein